MRATTAFATFAVAAYGWDVLVRPKLAMEKAKHSADGKPVLHVVSTSKNGTARAIILGPSQRGDVNANVAGYAKKGGVSNANLARLPFSDNEFGSVVVAHALESTDSPGDALRELKRISSGPVYILASPWWAPHAWLNLSHRWLQTPDGQWVKLWQMEELGGPEPVHAGLENALTLAAGLAWLTTL